MQPTLLDDLLRVGPLKPMGYLPVSTLTAGGHDLANLRSSFERTGLKTFTQERPFGSTSGEAFFYVYDPVALSRLLQDPTNAQVLQRFHWPQNPDEFVVKVSTHAVISPTEKPLFRLIAKAFADEKNQKE